MPSGFRDPKFPSGALPPTSQVSNTTTSGGRGVGAHPASALSGFSARVGVLPGWHSGLCGAQHQPQVEEWVCFLSGTPNFSGLRTSLRWKNGCASWTALQILRGSEPASGGRVGIITPPTLRPEDGPRKPSVCECGRDRHTHLMRMVGASDNSDRCKGQQNLMRRAVLLGGSMSHLWKA